MPEDKFNEFYNKVFDEQFEFMLRVGLKSKSFDYMIMRIQSKILMLGNELLSGHQVYELLCIPDQVLLKVTQIKKG